MTSTPPAQRTAGRVFFPTPLGPLSFYALHHSGPDTLSGSTGSDTVKGFSADPFRNVLWGLRCHA